MQVWNKLYLFAYKKLSFVSFIFIAKGYVFENNNNLMSYLFYIRNMIVLITCISVVSALRAKFILYSYKKNPGAENGGLSFAFVKQIRSLEKFFRKF